MRLNLDYIRFMCVHCAQYPYPSSVYYQDAELVVYNIRNIQTHECSHGDLNIVTQRFSGGHHHESIKLLSYCSMKKRKEKETLFRYDALDKRQFSIYLLTTHITLWNIFFFNFSYKIHKQFRCVNYLLLDRTFSTHT